MDEQDDREVRRQSLAQRRDGRQRQMCQAPRQPPASHHESLVGLTGSYRWQVVLMRSMALHECRGWGGAVCLIRRV